MMMQVSNRLSIPYSFLFFLVIYLCWKSALHARLSGEDFTVLINDMDQRIIYQQICFSVKSLSFLCISPPYHPEHPCSTGFLDKALAKSSVYHWKLGIPGRQPTLTLAHSFCQFVRLALSLSFSHMPWSGQGTVDIHKIKKGSGFQLQMENLVGVALRVASSWT